MKKGSLFLEEATLSRMQMNEREYTFAVDIGLLAKPLIKKCADIHRYSQNLLLVQTRD